MEDIKMKDFGDLTYAEFDKFFDKEDRPERRPMGYVKCIGQPDGFTSFKPVELTDKIGGNEVWILSPFTRNNMPVYCRFKIEIATDRFTAPICCKRYQYCYDYEDNWYLGFTGNFSGEMEKFLKENHEEVYNTCKIKQLQANKLRNEETISDLKDKNKALDFEIGKLTAQNIAIERKQQRKSNVKPVNTNENEGMGTK